MAVEPRPIVQLAEEPEIVIGDINDITGTIADKDRYLLNTTGTRVNPATEDTLSGIKTQTDKLTFDVDNNLKINLATSEIKLPVDIQDHWAEAVTLLASGARTASGIGSDVDVGRFLYGTICVDVTAVSGTFGTGEGLRVIVEGKDEVTGKYTTLYDSFKSVGTMIKQVTTDFYDVDLSRFRIIRVRYIISGTTPSFTFSVSMQAKA